MNKIFLNALFCFLTLAIAGCGGGGGGGSDGVGTGLTGAADSTPPSSTTGTDNAIASAIIVSGNNQTAAVKTQLTQPLVVMLKNQAGQPIAGKVLNFVVTEGGGSVFASASTSDGSGILKGIWTVGTVAGVNKLEVRGTNEAGSPVVYASFTATTTAGPALTVAMVSGNVQTGIQSQPLPSAVTVAVKDLYGNLVPGTTVVFTPNSGGSAVPGSMLTNSGGLATTTWTLGSPIGVQALSVAVSSGATIRFESNATSSAAGVAKISGDFQTVVQYSFLAEPLIVTVIDRNGNPPNTTVLFTAPSTAAATEYSSTVSTFNSAKGASSGVDALYFNTLGQQQVIVSTNNGPGTPDNNFGTAAFTVNVVAPNSAHPYDGLYVFGSKNSQAVMKIVNGKVVRGANVAINSVTYAVGTFNEADGSLNVTLTPGTLVSTLVGSLVIDSQNRVSGSGTTTIGNVPDRPWTATRQ